MLTGAAYVQGNMPSDLQQKVMRLCSTFDSVVQAEVKRLNLPPAIVTAALPCNLLCLVDQKNIHIVFTSLNVGGMPRQIFIDRRQESTLQPQQVLASAVGELAFQNPSMLYFDSRVLDVAESEQLPVVERVAKEHVQDSIKAATRPRAIPGYEGLQSILDAFSGDHPDFEKNVFIAMRFRPGKQFLEIHEAIKTGLAKFGLKGLRVDDKTYPSDGDLWNNICVYMMGCKFGVCVFEEIDEREFNPNVPLEYGFMRAMNRQVLLLKDMRMPKLPSDMTGKLYRHFNTYEITATVHEQIGQWAERDLGLKSLAATG
ncbi:MAG: hypothetical protein C0504_20235 [Candidatus Solibacter sp.]|nr:hypothetical protein [Candidatus Solibacter sp.]